MYTDDERSTMDDDRSGGVALSGEEVAAVRRYLLEEPLFELDVHRFEQMAQAVLQYQRANNRVYARFSNTNKFLPVEAFKHAPVTTFPAEEAERVFESSGTGGGQQSRHYVRSLTVYERVAVAHFEAVFGRGPFTFVAHLPEYATQGKQSSLLYMVETLIRRYGDGASGFFLENRTFLDAAIVHSRRTETPLLLFGAAFGLLDLIEEQPLRLPRGTRVIETGGMKTHRRVIGRTELHARLAEGLGVDREQIFSEYGMCELLSQCYTRGGEVFYPPPWMRVYVVDPENPAREVEKGQAGVLALFDLANLYTASALLTQDRAVREGDGFRVLGRLSQAELRGCNFLVVSS